MLTMLQLPPVDAVVPASTITNQRRSGVRLDTMHLFHHFLVQVEGLRHRGYLHPCGDAALVRKAVMRWQLDASQDLRRVDVEKFGMWSVFLYLKII